jgi:hypothetical protein
LRSRLKRRRISHLCSGRVSFAILLCLRHWFIVHPAGTDAGTSRNRDRQRQQESGIPFRPQLVPALLASRAAVASPHPMMLTAAS